MRINRFVKNTQQLPRHQFALDLLHSPLRCEPRHLRPCSSLVISTLNRTAPLRVHYRYYFTTHHVSASTYYKFIDAPTSDIQKLIEWERLSAVRQIDGLLKNSQAFTALRDPYPHPTLVGGITRLGIQNEILAASNLPNQSSQANEGDMDMGPTGNYRYFFKDFITAGTRSYIRQLVTACQEEPQVVFVHNFHRETLASMSLSVDESYVVRLVEYLGQDLNARKQRLIIRHIDTGVEHEIDFQRALKTENGMTHRHMRLHNVEFGPKVDLESGSNDRDLQTLFFTTCDESGRPDAVHGCIVFGNVGQRKGRKVHSSPELVFRDNNSAHFVDVQRTKGCNYVAIQSSSKTCNEVYLVGKGLKTILVRERQPGIQYFVDCGVEDDIVVMAHTATGYDDPAGTGCLNLGKEFSVFEDRVENLPLKNAFGQKVIATSDTTSHGYFIENIELFFTHIALHERSFVDGTQRLRVVDRRLGHDTKVPLKMKLASRSISPCGNMHFQAKNFQFNVESPVYPPITCHYNFESGEFVSPNFLEQTMTDFEKNDFMKSKYITERILVDVDDETRCPLTILYEQGTAAYAHPHYQHLNYRPVVLIGYGCYGENQNLAFDPKIAPLIARGFAIAYCHGRGGRELGQKWYEDGCHLKKINAVRDFIACARYLSSEACILDNHPGEPMGKRRRFIAAKGFSAGGVIVGAALNDSPELFQSVSLTNAFMDVMGTMSDPTLYLTEHEWDEFGNPIDDVEAKASISSYCPFTNVKRQSYPPMLLVGAVDDESVPYYHALAFGQKIRDHGTDDESYRENNEVFINIEKDGGHHLHGRILQVAALEIAHILGQYFKWCYDDNSI